MGDAAGVEGDEKDVEGVGTRRLPLLPSPPTVIVVAFMVVLNLRLLLSRLLRVAVSGDGY